MSSDNIYQNSKQTSEADNFDRQSDIYEFQDNRGDNVYVNSKNKGKSNSNEGYVDDRGVYVYFEKPESDKFDESSSGTKVTKRLPSVGKEKVVKTTSATSSDGDCGQTGSKVTIFAGVLMALAIATLIVAICFGAMNGAKSGDIDDKLSKLTDDVIYLTHDVSRVRSTASQLTKNVGDIGGDLTRLKQTTDDLTKNVASLKADLNMLKTSNTKLTNDVASLRRDLTMVKTSNTNLRDDIRSLNATVASLMPMMNTMMNRCGD